jgi:hypothetical protein
MAKSKGRKAYEESMGELSHRIGKATVRKGMATKLRKKAKAMAKKRSGKK